MKPKAAGTESNNSRELLKIFLITFTPRTEKCNRLLGSVFTSFSYFNQLCILSLLLLSASSKSNSEFLSAFLQTPCLCLVCSLLHRHSLTVDSQNSPDTHFLWCVSGLEEQGEDVRVCRNCATALKLRSLLECLPFQFSKWQMRKVQFY